VLSQIHCGVTERICGFVLVLGFCVPVSHGQSLVSGGPRMAVAIDHGDGGVMVSWRLLPGDPLDVGFDVYRCGSNGSEVKLNSQAIIDRTCFIDSKPPESGRLTYRLRCRDADVKDAVVTVDCVRTLTDGYLSIPVQIPEGYHANDASVGDLDGDGQLDIVVHVAGRGQDNSRGGLTDPPIFQAYTLSGQRLWQIQLGKNVREGAHYNPFLVYDFDQDGCAEFVCRTADGTIDGAGNVIGDAQADYRVLAGGPNRSPSNRFRRGRVDGKYGKILSGPEFLTVFDGASGAAIDSVTYLPRRGRDDDSPDVDTQQRIWGDDYGNRMDRFLATVAYLDGQRPSLVFSRGYYTRTVLAAWDLFDGKLVSRWVFDSDRNGPDDATNLWRGQGNHSLSVADLDDDGRDEVIFGAMVIDDDGQGLYSTGLGHGDAQHTSDLNPQRPGLETWSIHESERPRSDFIGAEMRDTRTGELLFKTAVGRDVGRAMAADIDPRYPGSEVWGGSRTLFSSSGEALGRCPRSTNMAIWWDGDLQRELLDGVRITDWDYGRAQEVVLFDGRDQSLAANNGSKNNPCLAVDIVGDWREELIARTRDNRELRIYVTPIPTKHRLVSLMNDRQYRLGISWQNVGYNQPPHPSFDLEARYGN